MPTMPLARLRTLSVVPTIVIAIESMIPNGPNTLRNPTTTTIGGKTNGTISVALRSDFPLILILASTKAPGSPMITTKMVLRVA